MKKIKKAADGTTMVEVTVAFAVLVLLMGIFSQAMGLAGRMMNRSSDTLEQYHQLAGEYFLDKAVISSENITTLDFNRVTKDGKVTGDGFSLQVKVRTCTRNVDGGSSTIGLYEVERVNAGSSGEPLTEE